MRRSSVAAFFLCVYMAAAFHRAQAGPAYVEENTLEINELEKKCVKMMDETLEAYNNEDSKGFYKNFASNTRARTERTFKYLWMEGNKARFGKIISRAIEYKKSSTLEPYPLLAYAAKFEKDGTVEIKFSFIKESGEYKIFSLRMDDVKEGEK